VDRQGFKACRAGRRDQVESELRRAGVFPFSDLQRTSIALPNTGKAWW